VGVGPQIVQQMLNVVVVRHLAFHACELKSQYGHFCTHHGM
jgi:hypothetical protein